MHDAFYIRIQLPPPIFNYTQRNLFCVGDLVGIGRPTVFAMVANYAENGMKRRRRLSAAKIIVFFGGHLVIKKNTILPRYILGCG